VSLPGASPTLLMLTTPSVIFADEPFFAVRHGGVPVQFHLADFVSRHGVDSTNRSFWVPAEFDVKSNTVPGPLTLPDAGDTLPISDFGETVLCGRV